MNWFAWRQHRKQFLVMGILLAAFAALTLPTGMHYWHTYQQTLIDCRINPANPTCTDLTNLFQSNIDQILFKLLPVSIAFLPVIFGIFWGAPLLAKEYNEGTDNLVWTQGISRRKWLTVKLAWMLAATAVFMALFAVLMTYWSRTSNALQLNRFDYLPFGSQGIVPVSYGLFTVALGIMLGAWFRKTMVAVGITIGLFIAVVLIAIPNFVRPHYMTPVTVTGQMGPDGIESKIPSDATWVLSRNILDKNNKIVGDIFPAAPPQCQQIIQQQVVRSNGHAIQVKASPAGAGSIDACLNSAGFHQVAKYQPSYRYWDFQRIEAGIYLGLSALVVGATYWLVLKRDA